MVAGVKGEVVGGAEEARSRLPPVPSRQLQVVPPGGAPSTRISRLASGQDAICISAGVAQHTFVQNPQLVRGEIFLLQDLQRKIKIKIERLTSSAKTTVNSSRIC